MQRAEVMRNNWERAFQTEGRASAKALRQDPAKNWRGACRGRGVVEMGAESRKASRPPDHSAAMAVTGVPSERKGTLFEVVLQLSYMIQPYT